MAKALGLKGPSFTDPSVVRSWSKSNAFATTEEAFGVIVAIGAHSMCVDGMSSSEWLDVKEGTVATSMFG